MARQPRLKTAKPRIDAFFRASQQKMWTRQQLVTVFREMRQDWQLASRTTTNEFIGFLIGEAGFSQTVLEFPSQYTWIERFWCREPTAYQVAMTIHPRGYFSHQSAMYLHGLVRHEPRVVYLNIEQTATGAGTGRLQQKRITAAFQRPARISNNRTSLGGVTICLLSGKNTGNLGVMESKQRNHGSLRLTDIERTLIDCTVRPVYSGGPSEVLNAYKRAHGKISVPNLAHMLERLSYIYPYNQAIGFYLERSGLYSDDEINMLRQKRMTHDFYLDYQMSNSLYSREWRLYYPAELDAA